MKRLSTIASLLCMWQFLLLILPILCNAQEEEDTTVELGADCSWPMHTFPIRHPDRAVQHINAQRYLDYMKGCYHYYTEKECRTSEKERMAMNFHQTQAIQNYTSAGYAKVKAPAAVMEALSPFYHENAKRREIREKWPPGAIYINHWQSATKMIPLDGMPALPDNSNRKKEAQQPSLSAKQRRDIVANIQPILETWCKMPLIATSLYGIRIYQRGAILSPHVDRMPLVISAIINVAQDLEEPWPLEVIGHDGKAVNVTMEPGEMVLYEGASVIHGRPYPLMGNRYANVFLHFEPVGHTERHMGLRKDPKTLFEQALNKLQIRQDSSTDEEIWRKKQGALPYYVDQDKEDQWKQNYVYVKRPMKKDSKDQKKRNKQATPVDERRRIHNYAAGGNLKAIQAMVRSDPDVATKADENGWTALHEAARAGHTHIVEYLVGLMDQESINSRTNNGKGATALWWAMHMHDEDHPTVKILIRNGARSVAPQT